KHPRPGTRRLRHEERRRLQALTSPPKSPAKRPKWAISFPQDRQIISTFAVPKKILRSRTGYGKHPQFLHYRPHRPRQEHFGRPPAGGDRHADAARNAGRGTG